MKIDEYDKVVIGQTVYLIEIEQDIATLKEFKVINWSIDEEFGIIEILMNDKYWYNHTKNIFDDKDECIKFHNDKQDMKIEKVSKRIEQYKKLKL